MTLLVIISLFLIGVATIWHFNEKANERNKAAEAALRVETAKTVQAQRAREDAAGVAEAAAQEPVKRKHRKRGL
jgi:hypothetical protein